MTSGETKQAAFGLLYIFRVEPVLERVYNRSMISYT